LGWPLPEVWRRRQYRRACAGPALKKTVNLVNLFATVRDKNKRIVGDMRQDDFKDL